MSGVTYDGEYQGPQKRLKDAIWFKSTHFQFGKEQHGHHSHAHTHYGSFSKSASSPTSPKKVDATVMRKTNFQLGSDNPTVQTTAGSNYRGPPGNYKA